MDKWRGHGFGSWDIVCNGLVDGMRHFSLVVVADGRLLVAGFRWQAFGGRLSVAGFGFLGNTVRSVRYFEMEGGGRRMVLRSDKSMAVVWHVAVNWDLSHRRESRGRRCLYFSTRLMSILHDD